MRTAASTMTSLGRGVVLLAPPPKRPAPFKYTVDDLSRHQRLLAAAQSLRGEIYVRDGAISSDSLTADGRHIQTYDFFSWHLLTVNESEEVYACMRFCAHG